MKRQWVQINLQLREIVDGVADVDGEPWVKSSGKWIPADAVQNPTYTIMKDIGDFTSPVDGSKILGRGSLREHNIRNGVTDSRDFTEQWARARAQRETFRKGELTDSERRELIAKEVYRRS